MKKVCVITGGGSGMGLATAKLVCEAGYYTILVGRTASKLEKAVADLRKAGHEAEAFSCDVSDRESCFALARHAAECGEVKALLHRVVVDDYMGAYTAVTHLIDTGCKKIAFYGSPMNLEISKNRYNGYHDALVKHGLKELPPHVRICDNRAQAEAITPEILKMEDRPDAFFAINDDTAIGILYTAKRMGFRVPENISVCGFTNGDRAKACDPMLTTVEQRGIAVGEEAANILIGQVEGSIPSDEVERRVVRTRLVVRGTTR